MPPSHEADVLLSKIVKAALSSLTSHQTVSIPQLLTNNNNINTMACDFYTKFDKLPSNISPSGGATGQRRWDRYWKEQSLITWPFKCCYSVDACPLKLERTAINNGTLYKEKQRKFLSLQGRRGRTWNSTMLFLYLMAECKVHWGVNVSRDEFKSLHL